MENTDNDRILPLATLVALPLPGTSTPTAVRFVGADAVQYLMGAVDSLVQSLWHLDLRTGVARVTAGAEADVSEDRLTHEERLRRERLRERALGITSYRHADGGRTLLVPRQDGVWIERVEAGVALGDGLAPFIAGAVLDPTLSPDGRSVAFVREGEIYVQRLEHHMLEHHMLEHHMLEHAAPTRLTTGACDGVTHGLAEFIAQEEMKRRNGLWWAPDSQRLAYARVDERHIPFWRIPHEGRAEPSWEDHRYPFAGADNARVALFVVSVAGGEPVEVDLSPAGAWEYLTRVQFSGAGVLWVQVQDRSQQRVCLLRCDVSSGTSALVRVDVREPFLELNDLFRPLSDGGYLWGTERTGFLHLLRVDADGTEVALTHGDWVVDDLVGVDQVRRLVYFLASIDGPLERHLYVVSMDGGPIERLTTEPGMHSVSLDIVRGRWIDTVTHRDHPPRTVVRGLNGGTVLQTLEAPVDARVAALALPAPELLTVTGPSGDVLHAALYRPVGPGPFPTVVHVYGGPHAQRVYESWDLTVDLRAQHLRSLGIAVLRVDNRGAARRGAAFAEALYGKTGFVEIEDQVAAVRELAARGIVDLDRVGIMGWSYGGYLALMALFRAGDVFKVGVAGAPVTHWDGYDTHYTERYMGMPNDNVDGYEQSSVLPHVAGLVGKLMVVHGMQDENVHFRHTGRLLNALIAAQREVSLQLFPDERHLPRKPADRLYMERRMVGFLRDHL